MTESDSPHFQDETTTSDRSARADLLASMALMSGLVYPSETIADTMAQEGGMDLILESPLAQRFIQQGIEQGAREFLLDVLALRFQSEEMHQLAARIGAIDDVQCLKQLHRAAIQAPSLEAFADTMAQEGGTDLESSFAQYLLQQGVERGSREFLLDVLALRFQPEEVQQVAPRIRAIDDVQRLKQLHRAAIQVPSLQAFRDLLDADE